MRRIFLCAVSVSRAAEESDAILKSMPPQRREKYDSARSDALRSQLLAAQAAMDGALAACIPGYAPPADFFYLPDGRPAVRGACISLSHTSSMAVCVAADIPVGVDIEEKTRLIRPEMARRVLMPGEETPRGILGAWVDKEAYLKLTGQGLSGGMVNYRAEEGAVFAADGTLCASIQRPEIPGYYVSVCCEEKFSIIMV